MPLPIKEVGSYRLILRLGSGDFTETFLAEHTKLESLAVIKTLSERSKAESEWTGRFAKRSYLWAVLQHPNLVRAIATGKHEGVPYLAMEYLAGEPLQILSQVAQRQRYRLTPTVIAWIFHKLASGLAHFHQVKNDEGSSCGPIHGGITPRNTFFCYDGQAKLMDFVTTTGGGFISHARSIEQHEHADYTALDIRADVFSLGLTAWELITGLRPLPDPSHPSELIPCPGDEPSQVLNTRHPNLPIKLRSILLSCVERNPERRFQSALALQHALSSYLQTGGNQEHQDAIARLSEQLLRKRKQLKDALIRSAIQNPNLDILLFDNLGDGIESAGTAAQAKLSTTPRPKLVQTSKITKSAGLDRRLFLTILTAAGLILIAVAAIMLWPQKTKEPIPPDHIAASQDRQEQIPAQTPSQPASEPEHPPISPSSKKSPKEDNPKNQEENLQESSKGYLRLVTKPQTSVYLNDMFIGKTPIEDMALQPGRYRFELVNKEAGISRVFRVRIRKGQVSSHTIIY